MSTVSRLLGIVACVGMCVSCGGGGGPTIGPAGGTVELEDGTKIEIPPGVLTEDVEIRLAEVRPEDLLVLPAELRHAKVPVAITPHGTVFLDDVKITLPHDTQADPKVVVRLSDENDGLWKIIPHTTDDGSVITIDVRKLSVFSVLGGPQPLFPGLSFRGEVPSQAFELGDVDNDADIDAIVGQNGGTVFFINDGSGLLEGPLTGPGAGNVTALMGWDQDAVGYVSALYIGLTGAPDEVWSNSPGAPGTFTDTLVRLPDAVTIYDTVSVSPPTFSEITASNLILTTTASGTAYLYEHYGPGSIYLTSPPMPYPSVVTAALIGNLTGNFGFPDIVFGTPGGTANPLWENDSMGTIFDAGNTGVGTSAASALAYEDVDGDLDLDVYVGTPGTAADEIWLFDSTTGTYSNSGQSLGQADTRAVALADLDGDGDVDAFAGTSGPDFVYWNDGSGVFTESSLGYGDDGEVALGVKVADLDGDLDLDVVVVNASGLGYVWLQS